MCHKTLAKAGCRPLGGELTLVKELSSSGPTAQGSFCRHWTSRQLVSAAPSQVKELGSPQGFRRKRDCSRDHSLSFPHGGWVGQLFWPRVKALD